MIPPITFQLELDNPAALDEVQLGRLLNALNAGALLAGQWIRGTWTQVAQGLNVRHTGAYIRGIQDQGIVRVVKEGMVGGGEDHEGIYEVIVEVVNTAAHASFIEEGHGAFHLPDKINWGSSSGRIKRTKDGRLYIHVPFRHSAYAAEDDRRSQGLTTATIKAMMPQHIYAQAKMLGFTQKLGVGPVRTASGQWVAADRYRWGGRLSRAGTRPAFIMGGGGVSAGGPGEPGYEEHRGQRQVGRDENGNPLVNPAWQSSKFHGMFRSGGTGHSQYMTIRTVTPDSPGWNIPAQAGLFIARRVAQAAEQSEELREIVLSGMLAVMEGQSP